MPALAAACPHMHACVAHSRPLLSTAALSLALARMRGETSVLHACSFSSDLDVVTLTCVFAMQFVRNFACMHPRGDGTNPTHTVPTFPALMNTRMCSCMTKTSTTTTTRLGYGAKFMACL